MSNPVSRLPAHPSLQQLRKRAKELLRRHRAGDPDVLVRFRAAGLRPAEAPPLAAPALADAQFVLAREYGFDSWARLKHHVQALPLFRMEEYEQLARRLALAHMSANPNAVREVNRDFATAFLDDFHDALAMHRCLPMWFASDSRTLELALADARQLVAHAYGFESWMTFKEGVSQPAANSRSAHRLAPLFINRTPPFYRIDWKESRLTSRGPHSEAEWETIVAVVKEHGLTALDAEGITDPAAGKLAELDSLTHLRLRSDALTDQGLHTLANIPGLVDLEIGGWQITDRGLELLRQLPELRRFQSCWTPGITDAGAALLAFCERLETVDLMGTAAGDGLIAALAGKPNLRRLKTGRGVTDAGIELLHRIPAFRDWHGGEMRYGLMSTDAHPTHLLIDGPFTDSGLAKLAGLGGLFGLSFFWHSPAFTSAGLEPLRQLPNLGFLGCEGAHCDDEALRQIAALPRLRMLMGQGAVATDAGWKALSRSPTIEYIWGRNCSNLRGRGFAALSSMPALAGIAVSCKHLDDPALSLLPGFPALRHIVPMDISDEGFRHIGACENLESLWCMYCRNTGDAATEHIGGLARLKTYYAGMTQITDRSLEILGRMHSLERLEFHGCLGITDNGIAHVADLPALRGISIHGSPAVSPDVVTLFAERVHVKYSG